MPNQFEKCEQFANLHQLETPFIIPNPWDAGSARVLQGLGFKALATTSAGFAFTMAKSDGQVSLEEKLRHCAEICAVTDIPVNVDFENGFAEDPKDVYKNILRLAETGVAGCSIEDFSRDTETLYDLSLAAERVQAAAEAIATLGLPFQLTARAENYLHGVKDSDDTIQRLQAYERAGANIIYAPGLASLDELQTVTAATTKPFNVLAPLFSGATVDDFAKAGAKRISLGAALTWACLKPLLDAGKEMLEHGSFEWVKQAGAGAQAKKLLNA